MGKKKRRDKASQSPELGESDNKITALKKCIVSEERRELDLSGADRGLTEFLDQEKDPGLPGSRKDALQKINQF